mmetsp:Transcript_9676/g.25854  ORF Transcript_9676/g.25854 Transcript_9676/m.25854 type:complete len:317 (-) Transcript_9676:55-1005(-)
MDRAIPVGNKVCAARVHKRYEDQRAERLRAMRPTVDARPPETCHMPHLKRNRKKDEILGQLWDSREKTDRAMLLRMEEFGKNGEFAPPRSNSLPQLNREKSDPYKFPGGPARRRELTRITNDNGKMAYRLMNMRPMYKRKEWEADYARSTEVLKRVCEYPPPLVALSSRRRPGEPRSSLDRLPGDAQDPDAVASRSNMGQLEEEEFECVLHENVPLHGVPCEVYMATDGKALAISAYDQVHQRTFEMLVPEVDHGRLYDEIRGDYGYLALRLYIDGDRLLVSPLEPLEGDEPEDQLALEEEPVAEEAAPEEAAAEA